MERADLLAALQRDGRAFADEAAAAGFDADVVSCPEWNVADLVFHLTAVFSFWGSIVQQRATDRHEVVRLERVPDADLLAVYNEQFARLLDSLTSTDPATPVWTWSAQNDVAFVLRRMAHETAVHRWDAGTATGEPAAIDAELASDGIDEYLEHFLEPAGAASLGGSVHLHCGDVAGEWTIYPSDTGYEVTRAHAKGDCALRGTANDLLLALWRRVGIDALDVVGDADVAARFLASNDND